MTGLLLASAISAPALGCMLWGGLGVAAVLGYPLWLKAPGTRWRPRETEPPVRGVTVLVVGRRGAKWLEAKLRNTLAAAPPEVRMEILAVSDGPDPDMRAAAEAAADPRIHYLETREWAGKNAAITHALPRLTGEVVICTDLDARLEPEALTRLLAPFRDSRVGAVCGRRRLESATDGPRGQRAYADWDAEIKRRESARGSLTSNDGKLYAIRRELVRPVPDGVTDDLFLGLEVVRRRFHLGYAPGAVARIPAPARSLEHEWARRRRVVGRGLRGLWRHRELFHPLRYGGYSLRLFVNKVLRRLLGVHALLALVGGLWLIAERIPGMPAPGVAALFGAAAVIAFPLAAGGRIRYATVGALASLAGCIDFAAGRGTVRWEPRKGGG